MRILFRWYQIHDTTLQHLLGNIIVSILLDTNLFAFKGLAYVLSIWKGCEVWQEFGVLNVCGRDLKFWTEQIGATNQETNQELNKRPTGKEAGGQGRWCVSLSHQPPWRDQTVRDLSRMNNNTLRYDAHCVKPKTPRLSLILWGVRQSKV